MARDNKQPPKGGAAEGQGSPPAPDPSVPPGDGSPPAPPAGGESNASGPGPEGKSSEPPPPKEPPAPPPAPPDAPAPEPKVESASGQGPIALVQGAIDLQQEAPPPDRERFRPEPGETPLEALQRVSRAASKAGDWATHSALESVIVSVAGTRHMIREAKRNSKGLGLALLEELEDFFD